MSSKGHRPREAIEMEVRLRLRLASPPFTGLNYCVPLCARVRALRLSGEKTDNESTCYYLYSDKCQGEKQNRVGLWRERNVFL